MLKLKARNEITGSQHWVETLRIQNQPRRMFGSAPAAAAPAEPPEPKSANPDGPRTGARDGEPSGNDEDDPP